MKDLLQPRFIVVAPIPFVEYTGIGIDNTLVGSVLTPNENLLFEFYVNNDYTYLKLTDYPHLFRPLHWSEFRTMDEMPKYVRFKGYQDSTREIIAEVGLWDFSNQQGWICITKGNGVYHKSAIMPATETEYNNFINQEK